MRSTMVQLSFSLSCCTRCLLSISSLLLLLLLLRSSAAVNDSALAAEVLVQYDINLKARTHATNETALEMAERLRSHLVAILLYEFTYRKS